MIEPKDSLTAETLDVVEPVVLPNRRVPTNVVDIPVEIIEWVRDEFIKGTSSDNLYIIQKLKRENWNIDIPTLTLLRAQYNIPPLDEGEDYETTPLEVVAEVNPWPNALVFITLSIVVGWILTSLFQVKE